MRITTVTNRATAIAASVRLRPQIRSAPIGRKKRDAFRPGTAESFAVISSPPGGQRTGRYLRELGATGARATRPRATRAVAIGPRGALRGHRPEVAGPGVAGPRVAGPRVARPQEARPRVAGPGV